MTTELQQKIDQLWQLIYRLDDHLTCVEVELEDIREAAEALEPLR